jgi:hypothetical protein
MELSLPIARFFECENLARFRITGDSSDELRWRLGGAKFIARARFARY